MKVKKAVFVIQFLMFCISISSFAQAFQSLKKAVLSRASTQFNLKHLTTTYPLILDEDTVSDIYIYQNGFLVLSNKSIFYPIKAYSNTSTLDTSSYEFKAFVSILVYDYANQKLFLRKSGELQNKNYLAWQKWAQSKSVLKNSIGPLLKSEFGQVNCKDQNGNSIYVTNYYTPHHYAVGCVALVLTTIMRYYNWPINGTGYYSYTDNYGNCTGSYSADFKHTTYQWDKIQDKYYKVPSSDDSRQALGRVAFDAAVSLDMDFEANGSTSNVNRIPGAVSKYFRYDYPIYRKSSDSNFWYLIDSSLQANSPVGFAVYTSSGAGHAIVCDGVQFTSDPNTQLYHLNMGWWGVSNAWYTIQSEFNAGGYSVVSAAVMGLLPVPQLQTPEFDYENQKLIVRWYYPDKIPNASFQIQVKQNDDGQWQTIANNLRDKEFSFPVDMNSKYYIRVKEIRNKKWSEEEDINLAYEISKLKKAKVYPTYAHNYLYVEYLDLKKSQFFLFDEKGNLVLTRRFGNNALMKEKISLPVLDTGIYFGKLITPEASFSFKIFILDTNPVSF